MVRIGLSEEYLDHGDVPDSQHSMTGDGPRLLTANVVCLTLATVFVLLRTYSKIFMTRCLGWDDYTCVMALVIAIAFGVCVAQLPKYQFGEPLWKIRGQDRKEVVKWYAISTLVYFATALAIKLSILLLYFRIFAIRRKMKFAIYALMVLLVTSSVAAFFAHLFACRPMEAFWDRNVQGWCLRQEVLNALILLPAGINLLTDLFTLIIPFPMILRLQLSRREKASVLAVFVIGSSACIASAIRMWALAEWAHYWELGGKWALYYVEVASIVEVNVGLMCACMPAFAALIKHYFPKVLGSSGPPRYQRPVAPPGRRLSSCMGPGLCSIRKPKARKGGVFAPFASNRVHDMDFQLNQARKCKAMNEIERISTESGAPADMRKEDVESQ